MRKVTKGVIFSLIFSIVMSMAAGLNASALWTPPTTPTCNAVYLVNADTGTVIYQKNAQEKIYPASTTKLMTAILVYEKFKNNLNTTVAVQRDDITPLEGKFGSLVPLKVDEQLTIEQLLNCLLIKSGDDSADVLARVTAGSIDKFVEEMNAKAKEIGAKYTHYVNPHGLHDPDHYTTAYDTYLIAKYAMQYDEIAKIVASPSYTMAATNKTPATSFANTNFLLSPGNKTFYYKYVKGIKTGTTTPAGACLVSYAEKDGQTYYCVAMGGKKGSDGSNTAFSETKALYQWVFGNFEIKPIVKTTDTAAQVKVELASNVTQINLVPSKQLNSLVPKDFQTSDIKITQHLPQYVNAPIKKGQKIGTEELAIVDPKTNAQQKLGTVALVASQDVSRSMPLYILSMVRKFFDSIWFKLIAALLILILICYVCMSVYYNKRKKMINSTRSRKYKFRR